jgi:hypothetical protein
MPARLSVLMLHLQKYFIDLIVIVYFRPLTESCLAELILFIILIEYISNLQETLIEISNFSQKQLITVQKISACHVIQYKWLATFIVNI